MRKILAMAGIALTSMLVTGSAFAQGAPPPPPPPGGPVEPVAAGGGDEADKKIGIGLDAQVLIPLGDFGDASGFHIGPMVRAGYRVTPPLELTLRIGYLLDFGKSIGPVTIKSNIVPILVGARYFFMEPYAGVYGAAEVGMNLIMPSIDPDVPGVKLDSQTRFGFNLGAGYVISKDLPIDFRAQFSYLNLLGTEEGEKSAFGLGLSVGYTFQF
jgi:outer membrane protein with beta-barrel domain